MTRTFISLRFQDLAARLVFKLIILAQKVVAKRAAENAATCTLNKHMGFYWILQQY